MVAKARPIQKGFLKTLGNPVSTKVVLLLSKNVPLSYHAG